MRGGAIVYQRSKFVNPVQLQFAGIELVHPVVFETNGVGPLDFGTRDRQDPPRTTLNRLSGGKAGLKNPKFGPSVCEL